MARTSENDVRDWNADRGQLVCQKGSFKRCARQSNENDDDASEGEHGVLDGWWAATSVAWDGNHTGGSLLCLYADHLARTAEYYMRKFAGHHRKS
jgi:hypothetical protein